MSAPVGARSASTLLASGDNRSVMAASFIWRSQQLSYDRNDIEQQKAILLDTFAGMGWETTRRSRPCTRSSGCTSTR